MPHTPAEQAIEPTMRPDHHGLGVEHPDTKPRKKRGLFARIIRWGLLLVLLLVLLAALAPLLLSTGPGTRLLVSIINGQIEGELEIDDLKLSWIGGQHATGVRYTDENAGLTAEIDELRADDVGLFDLLTGGRRVGEVRVINTAMTYHQPADRAKAGRPKTKTIDDKPPFALPATLSGSVVFENLTVDYFAGDIEPVNLSLARGTLEMPTLRDIKFDFDAALTQGKTSGRLVYKGEVLNLFDPEGVIQAMKARYDIDYALSGLSTNAADQLVSGLTGIRPGVLQALLGKENLSANGIVKGTVEELSSEFHFKAQHVVADLIQEREGSTLIASEKSKAELLLVPDAFTALFPKSRLRLAEPTRIDLRKLQFSLPQKDDAFDWANANATLELAGGDNFVLLDEQGNKHYVDTLRLTGNSASIEKEARLDLSVSLATVDNKGKVTRNPVEASLIVRDPLDKERAFDFESAGLPIAFADKLTGQDGKLVMWLGDMLGMYATVNAKIVTDAQGVRTMAYTYSLQPTGQIDGTVTGAFDQERYTFSTKDKQPIKATLVPEAFASLMEMVSGRPGDPALRIDKAMPVYITLRTAERGEVSIATDPTKTGAQRFFPDPDRTYVGVTIELTPATVYDPHRKATYELRGGTIQLSTADLRGKVDLSADLKLWVRPDAGKEGVPALLTYKTTVTKILDTEGGIPLDAASFMKQVALSGGVKLDHAPSALFDTLINRDGDIASIMGPIVQQMQADFTYADGRPTSASLKLNWDEKNDMPMPGSSASMKPAIFDIDGDKMLTVRGGQDLELEVKVSEAFGDRWMGRLHPILLDAKSGDRPVKIKIDGKSFKFPLDDPTMKGANVQAMIDLGTVEFGDNAMLGRLMQWTNKPGDRAVFEPARVMLKDGKLSYDDFDLAVGNVRLQLDGKVDLALGKIDQMAVRVPGESLIRVFNELEGVIRPEDSLIIPMSGELRQPRVDYEQFNKELVRMLGRSLIQPQTDKLRDKVREELGIDEDQPGGELIEGAFDLIFGRRPQPQKPQQQPNE